MGVEGSVRGVLRLEGGLLLVLSLWLYRESGEGWRAFLTYFLLPDLSFLAYLWSARAGSIVYNALHTLTSPLLLFLIASISRQSDLYPFVLIWTAHIGMDRSLGYGLKYAKGFTFTHLGPVGERPDEM